MIKKKSKTHSSSKTKSKGKDKGKKIKKIKKVRKTGGFPELIALTLERDKDAPDGKYLVVHPIDFSTINESTTVGIYKLRRPSHVEVQRKIKRIPKE
jgi:hypothetical protein